LPLRMARQWVVLGKAWCVILGQTASMNDLVGTFDPLEDITSLGTGRGAR